MGGFISKLNENEVFVFGSNEAGKHLSGAAYTAKRWGALENQASGLMGQTYAIPTVNYLINQKLTVDKITPYVNEFIEFAKEHPDLIFLVTEIGCGMAGHTVEGIAPLFKSAIDIPNIKLPESFK